MPEMFLCVPEDYYSSEMQAIIAKSISDSKNRWIYNIIYRTGVRTPRSC